MSKTIFQIMGLVLFSAALLLLGGIVTMVRYPPHSRWVALPLTALVATLVVGGWPGLFKFVAKAGIVHSSQRDAMSGHRFRYPPFRRVREKGGAPANVNKFRMRAVAASPESFQTLNHVKIGEVAYVRIHIPSGIGGERECSEVVTTGAVRWSQLFPQLFLAAR